MESEKIEAQKLLKKIEELQKRMATASYNKLSNLEKNLYHQQLGAMQTYYKCLNHRLVISSEVVDLREIRCLDHHEIGCKMCFNQQM